MKELRMLLTRLAGLRWRVALAVGLASATIWASVGLMGTAAWIIAVAALHPSLADLQIAIVGVRFFGVSRGVFRYAERLVSHELTFRLLADLRSWFVASIEPLVPARLIGHRSTDLLDRTVADIDILEQFYIRSVAPPAAALCVGISVSAFLLFWAAPAAAVFTLGFSIAVLALPAVAWKQGKTSRDRRAEIRSDLSAGIVDAVQGAAELVAWGRTETHCQAMEARGSALTQLDLRTARSEGLLHGSLILTTHTTMLAVCIAAIPLVTGGALPGPMLGVLCLVALAAFEAATPLTLAALYLGQQLEAAARLLEVVEQPPAVEEPELPEARPVRDPTSPPPLQCDRVSFRFPSATAPAIDGLTLQIQPGQRLAVVGPSGAGKTTLVHLMMRFWDPDTGSIRIDGADIRKMRLKSLRRSFGVVSQQTHLFHGTISENLRLARPSATDGEIETACRSAAVHGAITEFSLGYDTFIGERGHRLSGGQRQRLAVARMLLQRPAVIVLDESTAHLDTVTAARLLGSVFEAAEGRTLIHITHRLVEMDRYDLVAVLDHGRLVQHAPHHELASQEGLYRRMLQAEASLI